MMKFRRARIRGFLMAAVVVTVLSPLSARGYGERGQVGVDWHDRPFVGVDYCVDRQGSDKCLWAHPYFQRPGS
jgi:hypothetical protein